MRMKHLWSVALFALALGGCTASITSPLLGGTPFVIGINGPVPVIGGGTTPTPTPSPTPTPVPSQTADANTYPLALSAADATNTQSAGSGPDQLDIYMSSNPGGGTAGINDVVITTSNGVWTKVLVAPDFRVNALVGMTKAAANHLVLKGVFDCTNPNFKLNIKGVAPGGINGLWMMGSTCNYSDLVLNGVWDSRGGVSVNKVDVFDSNAADLVLTNPVAVPPPVGGAGTPAPPVDPTTITGALINGATAPANTLINLCASVPAGGTLTLPAGQIFGTCFLPAANSTIAGAGSALTIIDGKGIRPFQDKALIVTGAPGQKIRALTAQNSNISAALGANAAGIRDSGDGIGFAIDGDVHLQNNQNGVLAFASNFAIDGVVANDNGTGDGYTHDLYFGGNPTTSVSVSNSSVSKANGGHALKSRAGTTTVTNTVLTAGGNGAAIDVPDGGLVTISGGKLVMPAGLGPTLNMIAFGLESAKNAATGMTLTLTGGVSWEDATGAAILQCGNGGNLVIVDAVYTAANAPDIRGCVTTGQFRKAR